MSMPVIVPSTTKRSQAISDIIESVALEETGLSHILNAEGEKIQQVIKTPGATKSDLLNVNSSVQCMIGAITKLEMILGMKLELLAGGPCSCSGSTKSDETTTGGTTTP